MGIYEGMTRRTGSAAIDLRSDTVTHPSPAMRRAMHEAEIGDDVFGEDPTVNRLEELSAERFGKEAGLLVASGTMGNLVSLLAHCGRGDEIIVGNHSHIFSSEQGGAAALGGIHTFALPNQPDGTLELDEIEAAIRVENDHYPRTKLIAVENTQNRIGGRVLTTDYMHQVGTLAKRHALKVHVDGARIFNAAVSLGVDAKSLAADADTLTFCLSKGLACPVGSVIVGSHAFIHEARRARKVVGGGMRQAGVFAAAGIVALNEMIERLDDDHQNAKRLAEGLASIPGIQIKPADVETNILFFELTADWISPQELAARMKGEGVLFGGGSRRIRLVTHYGVEPADIDRTLDSFRRVMAH